MYSRYHNCDPFLQKRITSPDMLMPLYVMDTMSNLPGLPGLFVAGKTANQTGSGSMFRVTKLYATKIKISESTKHARNIHICQL